jgi:hypothetical protein
MSAVTEILTIGASAIVVIFLFKIAMGLYPIPGLSDVAAVI